MLLTIIAVFSTILGLAATLQVFRWPSRPTKGAKRNFGITIIKPIRGLEPELAGNLHSFFNLQGNILFELLFCVKNPADPCIPLIRNLMALHPQVKAQLMTGTPDLGKNPKVSNMHAAWSRASFDLILISDSNVRVGPDYLECLVLEREKGAGLVTQAVYGAGGRGVGGHLDVTHLNSFYLKGTALAQIFGFSCVLGKCMLLSKRQFDALGGLFAVRNYLAEDLVAGEMMKDAGYKVSVAPRLLRQTTIMTSLKAYIDRHVRWARLRKCHFIGAYLFEPLLFESVWPILLIVFAPTNMQSLIGWACLFVQFVENFALYRFKFCDREAWRSFLYIPLKDVVAPVIWLMGLISNRVNWRGQKLELRFGGKLGSKYLRAARIRKVASRVSAVI